VTQKRRPAFLRKNPRPECPRRIVPDVLRMAALEIGNPGAGIVLMEAHDLFLH